MALKASKAGYHCYIEDVRLHLSHFAFDLWTAGFASRLKLSLFGLRSLVRVVSEDHHRSRCWHMGQSRSMTGNGCSNFANIHAWLVVMHSSTHHGQPQLFATCSEWQAWATWSHHEEASAFVLTASSLALQVRSHCSKSVDSTFKSSYDCFHFVSIIFWQSFFITSASFSPLMSLH